MARLRVSFSNAIKMVFELTKDGKESLESAVHKAALEFNENEPELLQKVKSIIDKESRKTGKVGRPPKKNNEESNSDKKTESTSNKDNKKSNNSDKTNSTKKANSTKKNTSQKRAANSEATERPVKADMTNYVYSGPVDVYCFNGEIATIDITIKVSAYDENEAILKIYEDFFNKKVPLCISTKSWKKYISETK